MNVIVGRRLIPEHQRSVAHIRYAVDKFSLYYPSNAEAAERFGGLGTTWPLLQGYAFRTAVLSGSLNRGGLANLGRHPALREKGLVVDSESQYEDCAYMRP